MTPFPFAFVCVWKNCVKKTCWSPFFYLLSYFQRDGGTRRGSTLIIIIIIVIIIITIARFRMRSVFFSNTYFPFEQLADTIFPSSASHPQHIFYHDRAEDNFSRSVTKSLQTCIVFPCVFSAISFATPYSFFFLLFSS